MRVIGLGLASTATTVEVAQALAAAGPVDRVAMLTGRAGHPALSSLPVPLMPVQEAAIRGIATPTLSPRIVARFGCGSVAEALALVASNGTLITTRQSCGAVTWAVAEKTMTPARKDLLT